MAFYSSKNANITINGSGIFANQASISSNASIGPVHRIGSSATEQYSTKEAVRGELSLNYYVTGVDPLKSYIGGLNSSSLPLDSLSGNFNGVYFNSGYLSSYSFSVQPYQVMNISANLVFFEDVKGTFSASSNSLDDHDILKFTDFSFSETGVINGNQLLQASYNYSTSHTPYYSVQATGETATVHSVKSSEPAVSMDLTTNDYSFNLPSSGLRGKATLDFSDSAGNLRESFYISGAVSNQSLQPNMGDIITKTLKINQSNLGLPPVITSLSEKFSSVGSVITVNGNNFNNIETVTLGDQELRFTASSNSTISFTIPSDSLGGVVKIKTKGGEVMSDYISLIGETPTESTVSEITVSDFTSSEVTVTDTTSSEITVTNHSASSITPTQNTISQATATEVSNNTSPTVSSITLSRLTHTDVTSSEITTLISACPTEVTPTAYTFSAHTATLITVSNVTPCQPTPTETTPSEITPSP